MKVKPLNDRVLVKRTEELQVTKGGIVIPDSAKEKPIEGKIVAVGPGKMSEQGQRMTLQVKEGDRSCSANTLARKSRSKAKSI